MAKIIKIKPESLNWPELFDYKPDVEIMLECIQDAFCLDFDVVEKDDCAVHLNNGEQVCEDSCVEFFMKTPKSEYYYNFEFNSIGVCCASKRKGRNEDVCIFTTEQYSHLKIIPEKLSNKRGKKHWRLKVEIPYNIVGLSVKPDSIYCNFYKCGDKTAVPHYISWSPVKTKRPDFHRPEFFREIVL